MSKFFLLLVAGLVTQAGAVEPSQSAPLCSPEHRAWFASVESPLVQWYDNECENLQMGQEMGQARAAQKYEECAALHPDRREMCLARYRGMVAELAGMRRRLESGIRREIRAMQNEQMLRAMERRQMQSRSEEERRETRNELRG